MKAITLYQPWATLVAIGAKKIETRSWKTNYRGQLAIHAGLNKKFIDMKSKDYTCAKKYFIEILTAFAKLNYWGYLNGATPRGVIIATCELVNCKQINEFGPGNICYLNNGGLWVITNQEKEFGDFSKGRFLWFLKNIKLLNEPIPTKGALGLWEWRNE